MNAASGKELLVPWFSGGEIISIFCEFELFKF